MPDIFNCGVSIKINRFVFVRHKCPTYKLATSTKGSLKTKNGASAARRHLLFTSPHS